MFRHVSKLRIERDKNGIDTFKLDRMAVWFTSLSALGPECHGYDTSYADEAESRTAAAIEEFAPNHGVSPDQVVME